MKLIGGGDQEWAAVTLPYTVTCSPCMEMLLEVTCPDSVPMLLETPQTPFLEQPKSPPVWTRSFGPGCLSHPGGSNHD